MSLIKTLDDYKLDNNAQSAAGVKYKTSTVTSGAGTYNFTRDDGSTVSLYYAQVSGLTFLPNTIMIRDGQGRLTCYSINSLTTNGSKVFSTSENKFYKDGYSATSTAFLMPVPSPSVTYTYEIYG